MVENNIAIGPNRKPSKEDLDQQVDEADQESFPASDPPSWTLGQEPAEDESDDEGPLEK